MASTPAPVDVTQNITTAKGMNAAQLRKWLLKRVDKRHRKAVKTLHGQAMAGAEFLDMSFTDLVSLRKLPKEAAKQILEVRDRFVGATFVWTLVVWPDSTPVGVRPIKVKGPFRNIAEFILALKNAKPNDLGQVAAVRLQAFASDQQLKSCNPLQVDGPVPVGSSPELPILVMKPWDEKKKEPVPAQSAPKKAPLSRPIPEAEIVQKFTSMLATALLKGALEQADAEEAVHLAPVDCRSAFALYERDNPTPFAENLKEVLAAKREQKRRDQLSKMSRKELRDTMRRHMTTERYTMAESLFEDEAMNGRRFTGLVWDAIKYSDGIGPDNAQFLLDWRRQYYEGAFEGVAAQQHEEEKRSDPNLCSATVENLLEKGLPYEDVCGDCRLPVADHGMDKKFQERMSGILKEARAELAARDLWRLKSEHPNQTSESSVGTSAVQQSAEQPGTAVSDARGLVPVQPEPAPEKCKCGKPSTKYCSACKMVWYCSRECQTTDWKKHRLVCATLVMQRDNPNLKDLMPVLSFVAANGITKPERITACVRMLSAGNDVLRCVQSHPWLAQPKTLAMYQLGVKYFTENRMKGVADKFESVARDLAAATKLLSTSASSPGTPAK